MVDKFDSNRIPRGDQRNSRAEAPEPYLGAEKVAELIEGENRTFAKPIRRRVISSYACCGCLRQPRKYRLSEIDRDLACFRSQNMPSEDTAGEGKDDGEDS